MDFSGCISIHGNPSSKHAKLQRELSWSGGKCYRCEIELSSPKNVHAKAKWGRSMYEERDSVDLYVRPVNTFLSNSSSKSPLRLSEYVIVLTYQVYEDTWSWGSLRNRLKSRKEFGRTCNKRRRYDLPLEKDVDNNVYRRIRIEFILLHNGNRQQCARRILRYSLRYKNYDFLSFYEKCRDLKYLVTTFQ